MIRWAIKAGLIRGEASDDSLSMAIPNQMQIVYEPDCAALSIQYAVYRSMKAQKKRISPKRVKMRAETEVMIPQVHIDVPLKEGDKYILLDVGGGTCDVACHRVVEDRFAIAEVLHPSGLKSICYSVAMYRYYQILIFLVCKCRREMGCHVY